MTCAGSLERHPRTVARLRALLREQGLADRVSLVGELDAAALAACYDRADLFVLATLYETYGMAVAEALARGLPIVSTTTGAIPDIVGLEEEEAAGLLVAPGDARAFGAALSRVLGDSSGGPPGVNTAGCSPGRTVRGERTSQAGSAADVGRRGRQDGVGARRHRLVPVGTPTGWRLRLVLRRCRRVASRSAYPEKTLTRLIVDWAHALTPATSYRMTPSAQTFAIWHGDLPAERT